MSLFQLVRLAALCSTLAVACSSGSRLNLPGRQCPINYDPFHLKLLNENQKVWKTGQNESSIPVGTYTYQRADVVFTEKGDKGAIVHIEDVPERGAFKTRVSCVRNAVNLWERNITVAANVVSKMIAQAGVPVDVEGKELSFKINERRLVSESKAITKPESLEKVYEGKSQDLYMLAVLPNNIDYEIRSVFEDNIGKYVVSVKFKRTNN